ncbi:MAG: hypothetical protein ABGZ35_01055 [Planctomycetaceae bacterium]|jgi:hypothetical protein
MSKILSILAAAMIAAVGPVCFAGGDDLFSDVRTNSVFDGSSSGNPDDGRTPASPTRITRPEEVRELLKSAGFEAKVASNRTVTTAKELEPWTFPVMVILSEDVTSVNIVLGLSTIKDVSRELPAEKLLKMMEACQKNAPALFAYHAKRQRTELSLVLKNQNLTGLLLRNEINRLAILAKNTGQTWARKTRTPATTGVALVGRWSAAGSAGEAFALEFAANGRFNLVYINNGQQTNSTGRFTVTAGSLRLVGNDGMKLEGRLTLNSAAQFRFEIQNSRALVFEKA